MKTALFASDLTGSIISEIEHNRPISYTPFGFQNRKPQNSAFIGALSETFGGYLFGNGRRLYSQSLQRFTQPDPISPFNSGFNSYDYANQDPINKHDRSGLIAFSFSALKKSIHRYFSYRSLIKNPGSTSNIRVISDQVYVFDHYKKTGKELVIVAHGRMHTISEKPLMNIPIVTLSSRSQGTTDGLMDLVIPKVPELDTYKTARALICHSGTLPWDGMAMGHVIAQRTRLPTKAYRGKVRAWRPKFDPNNITASVHYKGENPLGGHNLKTKHLVDKSGFYVEYRPAYFYPYTLAGN